MRVGDFIQVTGTARILPAMKPVRRRDGSEIRMPPDQIAAQSLPRRQKAAEDRARADGWDRLRSYLESLPLPDGRSVREWAERKENRRVLELLILSAAPVSTQFDERMAAVVMRVDSSKVQKVFGTDFR